MIPAKWPNQETVTFSFLQESKHKHDYKQLHIGTQKYDWAYGSSATSFQLIIDDVRFFEEY